MKYKDSIVALLDRENYSYKFENDTFFVQLPMGLYKCKIKYSHEKSRPIVTFNYAYFLLTYVFLLSLSVYQLTVGSSFISTALLGTSTFGVISVIIAIYKFFKIEETLNSSIFRED
ncbi:hypothetical protein [Vibrio campbellii]|uniref:hypothetical protein n=1 Tax=Vibrio campbellii TaxID=680 RepID=UPI000CD37085|nr:hypothetical protein [Vibrio campbellii]AUW03468.1 hypothetical protein C1N51_06650 [Vibrio campbellii]